MKVFYFIYAILSAVIAIGVLADVSVEVVLEQKRKRADRLAAEAVPSADSAPAPTPRPVETMPEPVREIDVESADRLISDALAMSAVSYEKGAGKGLRGIVNIGRIDAAFEAGETVSADTLKAKGLLSPQVKRVKILADGILRKPLTVKAEAFSVQAVKMIELTGGTVVLLQD